MAVPARHIFLLCTVYLLAITLPAVSAGGRSLHHVVVCNGFADDRGALVSERLTMPGAAQQPAAYGSAVAAAHEQALVEMASRPAPHGQLPPGLRPSSLRPARRKLRIRTVRAVQEFGSHRAKTVWSRQLAFGACEEYYTDLSSRKLAFTTPDRANSCEFFPSAEDLKEAAAGDRGPPRLALVLAQRSTRSSACAVRAMILPPLPTAPMTAGPLIADLRPGRRGPRPAQLVALDAFVPSEPVDEARSDELDLSDDSDYGDLYLPALDRSAEIKLEDEVEPEVIATEVIGTRTLGLDHVYLVEPKHFIMALEDIQGSEVLDKRKIAFQAGKTYISFRTGRAGDARFPQRLFVYTCGQQPMQPAET